MFLSGHNTTNDSAMARNLHICDSLITRRGDAAAFDGGLPRESSCLLAHRETTGGLNNQSGRGRRHGGRGRRIVFECSGRRRLRR